MSLALHSQLLASTGALHEGVSTASVGNLSYLYGEEVEVTKARALFLRQLGTATDHGVGFRPLDRDVIVEVDESYRGLGMSPRLPLRADALVTRTAEVGLFLLLGDCLGVMVYDPRQGVVALAHCGWRSTNERLAAKLIAYLQAAHGSAAEDLLVYLTPVIAKENYWYDDTIRELTQGWGEYIRPARQGGWLVDLQGYNLEQLRLAGVRSKNIESAGMDTFSSERLYSHVRSLRQGSPAARFGVYIERRG